MAPSAMPLIEEFQSKTNPSQDFGVDIDRSIGEISSTLQGTIQHVHIPPKISMQHEAHIV
jgi:metal-dependent amidase/aminoacylase/carboxypeptidase family protein